MISFLAHLPRLRRALALTCLMVVASACTATHPPQPYLPSRDGLQTGETIVVKPNDNVYTIARDHNVSMREIIVLNNLKAPFEIRAGQSLILPAGGSNFNGDMKPPSPSPLAPVEKNALAPIMPSAVSSQPLSAPPSSAAPAAPVGQPLSVSPQPLSAPQSSNAKTGLQTVDTVDQVQYLNRPAPAPQPAATTASAPVAAPAAAATAEASLPMVWPVQGPIVSSFGSKGAGLNNDGINIRAPKGSPIVAAAPGTVVYAGDEMKGFGNLVLIRHPNEWVTAYAHMDRVMVKKDSVVGQGDMIGTVGKTGNVSSPQLHFETRQNGKPVDPAQVIKSSP